MTWQNRHLARPGSDQEIAKILHTCCAPSNASPWCFSVFFHGFPMVFVCFFFMVSPWCFFCFFHGFPTVFLVFFHGFAMFFSVFFHGFPMVFSWRWMAFPPSKYMAPWMLRCCTAFRVSFSFLAVVFSWHNGRVQGTEARQLEPPGRTGSRVDHNWCPCPSG